MGEAQPTIHLERIIRGENAAIARVTIDNARKLNCLGPALMDQLTGTLSDLSADDAVRAVVLTGAGDRAFIGGADIRVLNELSAQNARGFITKVHEVCAAVRSLPVPVIARINGYCLGAGLEIAAACDLRLADPRAVFGMPEVRVGLPSVVEAALLPRLVGWGKAREIVLLGLNYSAQQALQMGLVECVAGSEGLDAALDVWLEALLACGPRAVRLQKSLIDKWERLPLDEAIEAGIDCFAAAMESDEPRRLTAAFLDRRRG